MTVSGRVLGSFVLAGASAIVACSATVTVEPGDRGSDAGSVADASPSTAPAETTSCGTTNGGAQTIAFGAKYTQCQLRDDASAVYELTAPESIDGGYVQLHLTNVVGSPVKVTVISLYDKSELLEAQRFDDDAPVHGYFAVKGGTSYRVTIERKHTYDDQTSYDLGFSYTSFVDTYEPNNDIKSAKPVSLATDIQASTLCAVEGRTTSKDEDCWDYFSFNAVAGNIVAKLTNPDPGERYEMYLYDATGKSIVSETSPSEGADARLERTVPASGTYLLRVRLLSYYEKMRGDDETPPPMYSTPYTLRIEQ